MRDDEGLRRAFDSLRMEDELRAPSFEGTVRREARPVRSRHRRLIDLALPALALIVAIVTLEVWHRPVPKHDRTLSILAWKAATDFLLDTPGSELMRHIPEIGSPTELPWPVTPAFPATPHVIFVPERSS